MSKNSTFFSTSPKRRNVLDAEERRHARQHDWGKLNFEQVSPVPWNYFDI